MEPLGHGAAFLVAGHGRLNAPTFLAYYSTEV